MKVYRLDAAQVPKVFKAYKAAVRAGVRQSAVTRKATMPGVGRKVDVRA